MLARIRAFFAIAEVLEVETPTCCISGNTDPTIESLTTCFTGPNYPNGVTLYLHTSPEFSMKRLLAAGSGPIYQICHVYRNGELGIKHHPEFSMLEWYRPNFSYHQLMDEVADLIKTVATKPIMQQRLTYRELFEKYLQLNPYNSNLKQLRNRAIEIGINGAEHLDLQDIDSWLDLLLTHSIQPQLPNDNMLFVYDYPESQATGAYVRSGFPSIAERFELYLGNMEIANGYTELGDATEQERRFKADLITRQKRNLPPVPIDHNLLKYLQIGLPACAGVAIGLDRLLMWLIGAQHIEQVLASSQLRGA